MLEYLAVRVGIEPLSLSQKEYPWFESKYLQEICFLFRGLFLPDSHEKVTLLYYEEIPKT